MKAYARASFERSFDLNNQKAPSLDICMYVCICTHTHPHTHA